MDEFSVESIGEGWYLVNDGTRRWRVAVASTSEFDWVFVNGQVDSFISVVIGSPLDLVVRAQQGKGKPVYFMPFADFGIAPMGQGVLAHERPITEKPVTVFKHAKDSVVHQIELAKAQSEVDQAHLLAARSCAAIDSAICDW